MIEPLGLGEVGGTDAGPTKDRDIDFGMKAVEMGVVQPLDLQSAFRKLNERRMMGEKTSIPQILVEMGLVTAAQSKEVLNQLSTTLLICTNPRCGKTYNVKAFDPGRKYACQVCKAPLVPENPEDAGEVKREPKPAKVPKVAKAAKSEDASLETEADPRTRLSGKMQVASMPAPQSAPPPPPPPPPDAAYSMALDDDQLPQAHVGGVSAPTTPGKGSHRDENPLSIAGVPVNPSASDDDFLPAGGGGDPKPVVATVPPGAQPALPGPVSIKPSAQPPLTVGGFGGRSARNAAKPSAAPTPTPPPEGGVGQPGGEAVADASAPTVPPPAAPITPMKKAGSGVGLLIGVILVVVAAAAGGVIMLLGNLNPVVKSASPTPSANNAPENKGESVTPADDPAVVMARLEAGRKELSTITNTLEAPEAKFGKLVALVQKCPELIEAALAAGKIAWSLGQVSNAKSSFSHALKAELPKAVPEPAGIRSEAGFWLGVAEALDETTCDWAPAQAAFAKTGALDGSDYAVVAKLVALANPAEGLAGLKTLETPAGRIGKALLLARGYLPCELTSPIDDASAAEANLSEVLNLAAGQAPHLNALCAFIGYLRASILKVPTADAAFTEATKLGGFTAEVALYRALAALGNKETATAQTLLNQALKANPNLARGALLQGRLLAEAGKFDEARALLEKAQARLPQAKRWLGWVLLMQDEYAAAIKALEDFKEPLALSDLGLARLLTGDIAGALAALRSAKPNETKDATLRARYGLALHLNDQAGASSEFAAALLMDPDNVEAKLWRARMSLDTSQLAGVAADLESVLAKQPENWRARLMAAELAIKQQRKLDAFRMLREADNNGIPPVGRQEFARLQKAASELK